MIKQKQVFFKVLSDDYQTNMNTAYFSEPTYFLNLLLLLRSHGWYPSSEMFF